MENMFSLWEQFYFNTTYTTFYMYTVTMASPLTHLQVYVSAYYLHLTLARTNLDNC